MTKLQMKFTWGAILTLSEDYDIDFFKAMQDPMAVGISGLISIMLVGSQEIDSNLTREVLVTYLKGRKGSIGDELKYIFEEITKSLPSEDDATEK